MSLEPSAEPSDDLSVLKLALERRRRSLKKGIAPVAIVEGPVACDARAQSCR